MLVNAQGFFLGGWGSPIQWKFCQSPPPIDTCHHFWTKACPPPPQPRFIPENLTNLNTFLCQIWLLQLKSTLKSCISCLKTATTKNGLILHRWAGLASVGYFLQVSSIRLRPRRGPTGTKNFESPPPIKNLEKKNPDAYDVLACRALPPSGFIYKYTFLSLS